MYIIITINKGRRQIFFVYADDLLLFATTTMGLQESIDKVVGFLGNCGMRINTKSLVVEIKAAPHLKKTAVDASIDLRCDGQRFPTLRRTDKWRYLGVPEGRFLCRPADILTINRSRNSRTTEAATKHVRIKNDNSAEAISSAGPRSSHHRCSE